MRRLRHHQRLRLVGCAFFAASFGVATVVNCTYSVGEVTPVAEGGTAPSETGPGDDADGTADAATDSPSLIDATPCEGGLTNPKNCGACGHDCLGAACEAGICEYTTVAIEQENPTTLAVDDTDLYWGSEGAAGVLRCGGKACPAGPVALSSEDAVPVVAMAMTKSFLVWATADDVKRLTKGTEDVASLGNGLIANLTGLTASANDTSFYWGQEGGKLSSCPLDPGCGETPDVVGVGYDSPRHLNVTTAGLSLTYAITPFSRVVISCGASCGKRVDNVATVYAGGLQALTRVADDGVTVFWTDPAALDEGALSRATRGNPASKVGIGKANTAGPIATDAQYVYFVGTADGTVNRVAKSGGPVTVLAKGHTGITALAVDQARVYFATGGLLGTIFAVPK